MTDCFRWIVTDSLTKGRFYFGRDGLYEVVSRSRVFFHICSHFKLYI
jgi:hypothetical protein